jgi:protocatechuate 3,4-dioxygenase beta subunit
MNRHTDVACFIQLLDIGVIDVNTCKPLPNVLVDIWQANATGQYAGTQKYLRSPCNVV